MRAFFAIPVEEPLRARLAEVQDDLRGAGADVSWVRPESLHLTLKFLGDVDEGARFELACAAPFDLELAGVGEFGGRVAWAGCRGDLAPLRELAAQAERAGERVGVPREERPFSPHVTIGRIRSKRRLSELRSRMKSWKDRSFGTWPVRNVLLLRSDVSARGSVYKVVSEYPCTVSSR
jgi:2'-5' RNA ligase